jgi:hypothetical protein
MILERGEGARGAWAHTECKWFHGESPAASAMAKKGGMRFWWGRGSKRGRREGWREIGREGAIGREGGRGRGRQRPRPLPQLHPTSGEASWGRETMVERTDSEGLGKEPM